MLFRSESEMFPPVYYQTGFISKGESMRIHYCLTLELFTLELLLSR